MRIEGTGPTVLLVHAAAACDASVVGLLSESVTQWVTDWKWSRRKALVPRSITRCVMNHDLGHEVGNPDVAVAVGELPPDSLVLSGHIHNPQWWRHGSGHAWCFNPGVDFGRGVPNYVVIDTTAKEATLRGSVREIVPVRWTDVHG